MEYEVNLIIKPSDFIWLVHYLTLFLRSQGIVICNQNNTFQIPTPANRCFGPFSIKKEVSIETFGFLANNIVH